VNFVQDRAGDRRIPSPAMAPTFDLATTFVRLGARGAAEPVPVTPSFWRGDARRRRDRVLGAVDFRTPGDLHSSLQERHTASDEVLFLVAGAVDLLLEQDGAERAVRLEAGRAAIVPRGVWHRLVVREPGRLLFLNDRAGTEGRRWDRI
jgi:mannose-6-phosphate isomerase-like protein (cupin superfamily)